MGIVAEVMADPVVGVLSGLGSGGATAFVLWVIWDRSEKRHAFESDAKDARIKELTDKLLELAETGTKVAAQTTEVVREESPDRVLRRQLDRIEALLDEKGTR